MESLSRIKRTNSLDIITVREVGGDLFLSKFINVALVPDFVFQHSEDSNK